MLDVARNEGFACGRLNEREDCFAERARLREFDEAPFTVEPVFGEDQNDGIGARNLAIERAFPVRTGLDAGMLIEVKEGFLEAIRMQPGEQARSLLGVPARMADENVRNGRPLVAGSLSGRGGLILQLL
jgi:hypothetical protein